MATLNNHCPVCDANSAKPDFGRGESWRFRDTTRAPLSDDPVIAHRRERARRISKQNRS